MRKKAKQLTKTKQERLEEAMSEKIPVRERERPKARRHKGLDHVPSNEVLSGDVLAIMADALEEHADLLGWHGASTSVRYTAEQWSEILLRMIRYGIPLEEFGAEGFPIYDEPQDPPLCNDCREAA
jgi:hypothetical protein